MIFLLAYSHVHYVISFSMVIHMHIKLMNAFENWLIAAHNPMLGKSPM